MDAVGAPAAAGYQSHSGSIVETLEDVKAAHGESAALHAAMTKLCAEEEVASAENKQDLEDGNDGLCTALSVLCDFTEEETKRMERQKSTGIIGLSEEQKEFNDGKEAAKSKDARLKKGGRLCTALGWVELRMG